MFTHLHVHTEFSLLDGACRIKDLVSRAKELNMTHLAITDHGNMYGAVAFYKECKKQEIKPIIGCEVYVAPNSRFEKSNMYSRKYHHLVLLVKNEIGYKNLIKLVSYGYTQGFYSRPRIDKELLEKYHDGLICLSACLAGEIASNLVDRQYNQAKETAIWFNNLFGQGNYYLEIQDHNIDEQKVVIEGISRISQETGIPIVATNDVHYVNKEDSKIQQILICIATNKTLGDDTGLEFHSDEFYLKSNEEMISSFSNFPEAIENTNLIANSCNFDFEFGQTKLPFFKTPNDEDHFTYLKNMCFEGLVEHYGPNYPKEFETRLEYELNIVNSMGYTDYYLIVWDFVHYAKTQGIPVGPGRGSGAGSLAAYCIGITNLDPMKYDLIFERFLNPERVSMPDFDIDFCYERRQEVIDYVTRKYGDDHVAQIVTFGTLQTRAAIRDVGRVMGLSYGVVDAVAKAVPNVFKIDIETAVNESPLLRKMISEDENIAQLIEYARQVEGMPRNTSTHAAGVVITHDPVSEYVPLATNDDVPVTQYIMTELEELGLLKMDFLGLRTLTVINDAASASNIDIDKIDIDDQKVFNIFKKGQTEGIFQFESSGMKQMLTNLKPRSIEDLTAATSLYRPGPASQIPVFVENSQHPERIKYITPLLEPILKNTYGCIVYQEQVMQIFRTLAGYSYGRADVVRRAMSKKKHDVMEKERSSFIEGCNKNNIPENVSNSIFNQMTDFASYAFNKSHAACYALVAYRCAYLKVYFPTHYMAALLTSVLDSSNKVAKYITEAKRMGIKLGPPNINKSYMGFTADGDSISYGLLGIKNLGSEFIKSIIQERENGPYTDLNDFCSRLQGKHFNKRAVEALIRSGAMDNFVTNRRQMLEALPALTVSIEERNKKSQFGQVGFFDLGSEFKEEFSYPNVSEFSKSELLKMEKEITGLYLTGHPLDNYVSFLSNNSITKIGDVLQASDDSIQLFKDGDNVTVCGVISSIVVKKTRKNNLNMGFITIEDQYGSVEAVCFPETFAAFAGYLYLDCVICLNGTVSIEEEKEPKILVTDIFEPIDSNSNRVKNTVRHKKETRKGLFLKISSNTSKEYKTINYIINDNIGQTEVFIYFEEIKKYVKFSKKFNVTNDSIEKLKNTLGDNNVVYRS